MSPVPLAIPAAIRISARAVYATWGYVIADKSNGKKYVGSAYGDAGVWARWSCYIGTGHGWNDELTTLIAQEGLEYARRHFRMSLLEYRPAKTDDKVIFDREGYWKEALLSRGKFGYNKN